MVYFNAKEVKSLYKLWARDYDEKFSPSKWKGPERLVLELSSTFNLHARPLKALDIGIGTGLLSQKLKEQNPSLSITGIDFSKQMLRECEKKGVADLLINSDFQRQKMPFDDESFDLAVSTGVFELLNRPDLVIEEMGRVLKKGAAYSFTTYAGLPEDYQCHRHEDTIIEEALIKAGLENRKKDYFFAFNSGQKPIHYHLYTGRKCHA